MWGLERPLVSDGLSHLSLGTPDRVRLWQEAPLVPAKREPSVPAGRGVECRACGTLACRQTRFSCLVLALPCLLHLELSPGCVPAPRNTQGGGGVLVGGGKESFPTSCMLHLPTESQIPFLEFSASSCKSGSSAWTPGPAQSGQSQRNSLQNLDPLLGNVLRHRASSRILL